MDAFDRQLQNSELYTVFGNVIEKVKQRNGRLRQRRKRFDNSERVSKISRGCSFFELAPSSLTACSAFFTTFPAEMFTPFRDLAGRKIRRETIFVARCNLRLKFLTPVESLI